MEADSLPPISIGLLPRICKSRLHNLDAATASSWCLADGRKCRVKVSAGNLWLVILLLTALAGAQTSKPPKVAIPKPEPVYAQDANDSWNRIFCLLFSRRMDVRLSDEFPEGAPFTKEGVEINLLRSGRLASTRVFDRTESGDRAIDPLYPGSMDSAAARLVLSNPTFSEFKKALQDALNDNAPRSLAAKALMQSDLWSAHDIFVVPFFPADEKSLGGRRRIATDLLARLMKKIALTPEEIKQLPDNYSDAMKQYSLPDLFHQESGWIDTEWFADRQHDREAGYRRVSRIFLKPSHPPSDLQNFLDARPGQNTADLDAIALVMQLLVIDTQGNIRPTTLSNDIRLLRYARTPDGELKKTDIQVWELSRKSLLRELHSGGLVGQDENFPTYAVENYNFANNYFETGPAQTQTGPPVQVRLRTRCAACHRDNNLSQVRTFSIGLPPHPPQVRQLVPAANEEAGFDIAAKAKRKDFQELRGYFDRGANSGGSQ